MDRFVAAIFLCLLLMLPLLIAIGCSNSTEAPSPPPASIPGEASSRDDAASSDAVRPTAAPAAPIQAAPPPPPRVAIRTSLGEIVLELDADKVPETVQNFLDNYVLKGAYDNTTVHYVEDGFMLIGGGFSADGTPIDEATPIRNESHHGREHQRGTVGMLRLADYSDSATSQFFINLADNAFLDYESDANRGYCAFGRVVEGMEVVDHIAKTEVHDLPDFPHTPRTPIIIESMTLRR